jgi:hypothetical protein
MRSEIDDNPCWIVVAAVPGPLRPAVDEAPDLSRRERRTQPYVVEEFVLSRPLGLSRCVHAAVAGGGVSAGVGRRLGRVCQTVDEPEARRKTNGAKNCEVGGSFMSLVTMKELFGRVCASTIFATTSACRWRPPFAAAAVSPGDRKWLSVCGDDQHGHPPSRTSGTGSTDESGTVRRRFVRANRSIRSGGRGEAANGEGLADRPIQARRPAHIDVGHRKERPPRLPDSVYDEIADALVAEAERIASSDSSPSGS